MKINSEESERDVNERWRVSLRVRSHCAVQCWAVMRCDAMPCHARRCGVVWRETAKRAAREIRARYWLAQ